MRIFPLFTGFRCFGGIMWAGGDLVFLIALVLALVGWLNAEEVEGRRQDMLADMDAAAVQRAAARAAAERAVVEGGA